MPLHSRSADNILISNFNRYIARIHIECGFFFVVRKI